MLPIELWYLATSRRLRLGSESAPTATRPASPARQPYRPRRALALGLIRLGRLVAGRRRQSALIYVSGGRR